MLSSRHKLKCCPQMLEQGTNMLLQQTLAYRSKVEITPMPNI